MTREINNKRVCLLLAFVALSIRCHLLPLLAAAAAAAGAAPAGAAVIPLTGPCQFVQKTVTGMVHLMSSPGLVDQEEARGRVIPSRIVLS